MVARSKEEGRISGVYLMAIGVFWGDGDVLELVVMVAQCHECPKSH